MITLEDGLGDAKAILKRFSAASERRELWRSILQDMYDFCIPNRETFNFHNPGQRKARHLFDSTAPEALNTFVSVIAGSTTPDNAQWMDFEAGSDIPDEDKKGINKSLEDATKTFFKYLGHSDFQSQINTSHQDMAISTGCLMIEEGDDITEPLLKFTAIPLSELYLEPTAMAKIHTFFRKYVVKAQEIELKFPGADIPDKLRTLIADSPTSDVEIVDGSQVFNFKTKTYHQVVLWKNEVIFTQSYGDTPPGIIYRWSKVAGETYGRGPADMAMADIRTANKVKEYILKNAALSLSPPIVGVSDGVFNPHTVRIHPGTVMSVNDINSIKTLEMGGDLRLGAFVLEDLQANIRKIFFSDPLGEVDDPVKSALEQSIRHQESIKKRGANFGRLNSEFIFPLVTRVSEILKKDGKIAPLKVYGREVTLKMASPMGNAEQQQNVDNILRYMSALQGMPPEEQRIGANLEAVPAFLVDNLNLPSKLARSEQEIKVIKETLAQQAAAAAAGPQQPGGEQLG